MSDNNPLGSKQRPLRVAVVGSGPSGFYAAESLLKAGIEVSVDIFDRLPTPFGLARGGVAPDHQKIKAVTMVYSKVAANPALRFFGNVKLGKDIQADDLRKHYDAVIYAVGSESDNKLGIPGEDIDGSYCATAFVGWYNCHPDYRNHKFDLSTEAVAIVGVGNVAIDCARILAQDPEILAKTDIAGYAVDALRKSNVKTVYLLGRRGVAQAAFSVGEIKEMGELPSADLVIEPKEVELDEISQKTLTDPTKKKNVDYLTEKSKAGVGSKPRKVRLRFLTSPVEIIGEGGKVKAVKIEKNALKIDDKGTPRPKGTGEFETLPVGMVLRSVGYRGIPIPGVSFDEKKGRIPNNEGRVLDAMGQTLPGEYVVGWAKRGPSGLIGTNRADSVATVKELLKDIEGKSAPADPVKEPEAITKLLSEKKIRSVSFEEWKVLDRLELEQGKAKGKIREKFSDIKEMLSALSGASATV